MIGRVLWRFGRLEEALQLPCSASGSMSEVDKALFRQFTTESQDEGDHCFERKRPRPSQNGHGPSDLRSFRQGIAYGQPAVNAFTN